MVKSCPRPLSPTDIRSFLGLVRYYRRFVEGFYSISSPLTTLTQNKRLSSNGWRHVKKISIVERQAYLHSGIGLAGGHERVHDIL